MLTRSPATIPWLVAPSVTVASPVSTAGAGLEAAAVGPGVERAHRLDQVEGGPHGALGVVLPRDRRPPDRHDRIADELLDGAAVALDDLARPIEVARQQVAHGLRVAVRGERGEPDQVREQHRHEPSLGRRGLSGPARNQARRGDAGRRARCLAGPRPCCDPGPLAQARPALVAELGARQVRRAAVRARRREPRPALAAELGARQVLGAAVRADHGGRVRARLARVITRESLRTIIPRGSSRPPPRRSARSRDPPARSAG